jgi:hypothetical protein
VTVHRPIATTGLTIADVETLSGRVREQVLSGLKRLRP